MLLSGEKRPDVDYDARPTPTTPLDVVVWFPRVVFFPVYVVNEYVLRQPLGALTRWAEEKRALQEIVDFFTFGPEGNIGVVPTALIDFGLRPSVGVYFFYDDFLAKKNALRVHTATGGSDWLRLTVADRVEIDPGATVQFRAEAWRRPDGVFYGIGPRSLDGDRGRYAADLLGGGISFRGAVGGPTTLEAYTAVRTLQFRDHDPPITCCEDPPVEDVVRRGAYPAPPGFEEGGYTAYRLGLNLAVDTRKPRPLPGSGIRLEGRVEHDIDLEDPSESRWVRYGGSVGGFVDLTGHNRVLGLSISTLFADPLGDRAVPFTELATLGGDAMRGFRESRLIGRSAAVATLEYRYPIWAFLDGSVSVALGNTFNEHLRGFSPDLLRIAFWGGIRTSEARDHSFDLLVGSGTETFEQGAELTDLRFVFGAKQGF